jgi:hypothetical protein
MLSPWFGRKAPLPEAMVCGNGTPLAVAPAQADLNRFCRPCEIGFCALAGR